MALTKSQFKTYLDCPMHLWAEANKLLDPVKNSVFLQHLGRQGYKVEDLAEQMLVEKMNANYPKGSSLKFQQQLKDGNYEAVVDVVIHNAETDTYDLYEVKSSSHAKREHGYEITFQYLLAKSQFSVGKCYLVHINNNYVRKGALNLEKLFVIEDMTEQIKKYEDEVLLLRQQAKDLLSSSTPPSNDTCLDPKSCVCLDLCHYNLPKFSIFDLPDTNRQSIQYQNLLAQNIRDLSFIPKDFPLTTHQRRFLESFTKNSPIIEKNQLKQKLSQLKYPLYFLDYETFGPAVPMHDGYKPYQNLVFQYSLHIVSKPNDRKILHKEFLHTTADEPSRAFCESLFSHIGEKGSIISWYKGFENSRNKELAQLQPEFKDRLLSLNERTFDLMEIFSKLTYVDYKFRGSSSIKNVLPVLVPELNYENLNINKGDVAMLMWAEMVYGRKGHPSLQLDKEQIKKDLLEYCQMDTWAMVEIWQKLKKLV